MLLSDSDFYLIMTFCSGRCHHGRNQCRTGSWFLLIGDLYESAHPIKARIAEEAGACAVMALERVPADIRAQGEYLHQLTNPNLIKYGRRGR
jgi:pyridoxal biosynthesis lyase PdxS